MVFFSAEKDSVNFPIVLIGFQAKPYQNCFLSSSWQLLIRNAMIQIRYRVASQCLLFHLLFMNSETITLGLQMEVGRERWLMVHFFSHHINATRQLMSSNHCDSISANDEVVSLKIPYFLSMNRVRQTKTEYTIHWSYFGIVLNFMLGPGCKSIWNLFAQKKFRTFHMGLVIYRSVRKHREEPSTEITLQSLWFNIHRTHQQHIDVDCAVVVVISVCVCVRDLMRYKCLCCKK